MTTKRLLNRGRFLFLVPLAALAAAAVLQGCSSGGGPTATRETYIGKWTTDSTKLGKKLWLTPLGFFLPETAERISGDWEVNDESNTGFLLKPKIPSGAANIPITLVSVNATTLVVKTSDGTEITYTKDTSPDTVAFTITASISAKHTVGVSPCPQPVGSGVTITNTSTCDLNLSVDNQADLTRTFPATLAVGAKATIGVNFECTQLPPISRRYTVRATSRSGSGAPVEKTFLVVVNEGP